MYKQGSKKELFCTNLELLIDDNTHNYPTLLPNACINRIKFCQKRHANFSFLNFRLMPDYRFTLHRFLLIFTLLSLFGLQNCRKENISTVTSNSDFPITQRDADPLSEQAYNEIVTDEYEEQGEFMYKHLRYRHGTVAPEQYIASGSRAAFVQNLQTLLAASANKTYLQMLDEYFVEGILTQHERNLMLEFNNLIVAQENVDLSFGQAWYLIRNWEIQTQNNVAISTDDKELVLLQASALRNLMKYAYETGEIADDRGNGCFLGRKLSCWLKALGQTGLDTIKAGLGVLLDGGGDAWKKLKKAAFKAGGIAFVINVVGIYLNPDCKCDDGEPSGPVCEKPKGISIFPGDCNTEEQTFKAWGYTAPPGTVFNWVVENGVFPDNNNATSITTISPEVKVRQTNPNVPIKLAVTLSNSSCLTDYTIIENVSIPALVNDTGTLTIWGQNEVNSGSYHYKYEFWGTWLNSQNSVIVYSGCTQHGQVTESGIDYVKIQWNSTQPSYPTPKVTAIVKNLCSNQTLTSALNVIVY